MRTPEQALAWARSQTSFAVGYCLKFARSCYEVPSLYADASEAWANTKHRGTGTPPPGVPVWWTGGANNYGHVAISDGDGYVISTDRPKAGVVSRVSIDKLTTSWNLDYKGWSRDINGVLVAEETPWDPPVVPVTYVQGKEETEMPATSMSVHREDGRVDKVVIGANVDGSPNQRVYHGFSDDGIKFGWQEIDSGGRALWIDDLYWRGNQLIACVHGTDHCLYSASSKATGWNGFQRAGDKDNRVAVPPGT